MDSITAITTVCKTIHYAELSIGAFRKYYPEIPLIVVDNSEGDECSRFLRDYLGGDPYSSLIQTPFNIGHGPGMNRGMFALMTPETYGVGYCMKIDYIISNHGHNNYLHPLGCLISTQMFRTYPPFISGGDPFLETMQAINDDDKDITKQLIHFPVHRPDGNNPAYCKHYGGGTRFLFKNTIPNKHKGY
jgi:hypothetical protein